MREASSPRSSFTDTRDLFCMGFLTLFLELALIRYLAGNIWNLGYFPNLVLISVFVGMGLGFMLHQYASPRVSSALLYAVMLLLLALVGFVHYAHPGVPGFEDWRGDFGGDLYFTSTPKAASDQGSLPFIVCMVVITTTFAFLSQRTAKLFVRFQPLRAYTLDIAGSCAGIVCFMLVSWLGIPAWAWFAAFCLLLMVPLTESWRVRWWPVLPGLVIVLLVHQQDSVVLGQKSLETESFWSPYQRVDYIKARRSIRVNGVAHQSMVDKKKMKGMFYQRVHDLRRKAGFDPYGDVLILGAGSGNDVAAALANGARHVDAVEIDPAIAKLGKAHHPSKPYQSDKVDLVIDDGRAFMTRTPREYDLIVFALTDSLVKVSSMSQLRLENYLFTLESVRRAYALLKPGGDLVFYNYYRQPWLRDKIMQMIRDATEVEPNVIFTERDFAVVTVTRGGTAASHVEASIDVPTDDWPFLYLVRRGIPSVYRWAMLGMSLFVGLLVGLLHLSTRGQDRYGRAGMLPTKLAFLFMGIAFLLLETKSVIQFSLLFGTTWLNNSLVFLAVLVLVLAANWTAVFIRGPYAMTVVYACLLVSCLSTFFIPLGSLLQVESGIARFVLASLMTFSPIFFANLIFSVTFRDQEVPEHLFGWNLIGATIGGVAEYASMYFGYSFLAVVVSASYIVVIALLLLAHRTKGASPQVAAPPST